MRGAYYNEFNPEAAAWLRELIATGLLPDGVVDERSIEEVQGSDLLDFTQVHLFAGIGGWPYALRLAGWSDDQPVWTGSPPCQPFSNAGQQEGFRDDRHLWPHMHRLIAECRPGIVFGEQVESKLGRTWLDHVQTDLEGSGYAVGAVAAPSAGFGAPHIRSRLWFVALGDAFGAGLEGHGGDGDHGSEPGRFDTDQGGSVATAGGAGRLADADRWQREGGADLERSESDREDAGRAEERREPAEHGRVCGLADTDNERREHEPDEQPAGVRRATPRPAGQRSEPGHHRTSADRVADTTSGRGGEEHQDSRRSHVGDREEGHAAGCGAGSSDSGLANAEHQGYDGSQADAAKQGGNGAHHGLPHGGGGGLRLDEPERPGAVNGFWRAADWLWCRDEKWRPVEPGTFPLVDGIPRGVVPSGDISFPTAEARKMRLEGYGNAINVQQAAVFVAAAMEAAGVRKGETMDKSEFVPTISTAITEWCTCDDGLIPDIHGDYHACPECEGTGVKMLDEPLNIEVVPCIECGRSGCAACNGTGWIEQELA